MQFAEKLVGYIEHHGLVTRRELQQHIRGRYSTREVADILAPSIEAGEIVKTLNGYAAPSRV
jgi:hypothetical protein